jgi:hypothetical protein
VSGKGGTTDTPPRPPERGAPFLWVSTPTLPPDGGPLAVAVLNPTERPLRYGLHGTLDSWDGATWIGAGHWAASLSHFGTLGRVSENQPPAAAMGIGAAPHGVGRIEYLAVPTLASGWYRFGVGKAYGVVRVGDDASLPVDITNPAALQTHPTLIPTTGANVHLYSSPDWEMRPDTYAQLVRTLAPFVTLESFHPSGWSKVARLRVQRGELDDQQPEGSAVTIPPVPEGCHRIVRISPMVGPLQRHIWALEPPAGISLDR